MSEIRIVVDNRVRISRENLPAEVAADIAECFTHDNPEWGAKKSMGIHVYGVPKIIKTWKDGNDFLTIPRGGMAKVREVLAEAGLDWRVVDLRTVGRGNDANKIPPHRMRLYPYQQEALEACVARENCILRAPTGSGKTSILIAAASAVNLPTLVVVHSRPLLDQWIRRLVTELGMKPEDIGIIQGKKRKLRPITMAIQKSLANATADGNDDLTGYFGCVLVDEVHLFAATTFFGCVDPFPAKFRIGASADHRRKDRKEFLVHDLFGGVAAQVERKDLIQSGHVLDVEIRVVPTDFTAAWYGIPTEGEPELQLDFGRLIKEIQSNSERNALVLSTIRNAHGSHKQSLVMAHEREHGEFMARQLNGSGFNAGLLFGGVESKQEFDDNMALLRAGNLDIGVGTYKAIGTGIDLPDIGLGFACTPIASNEQFFGQVRGRFCRTSSGKAKPVLYYFWDRYVFGMKHLQNLVKWNPTVTVFMNNTWMSAKDVRGGLL